MTPSNHPSDPLRSPNPALAAVLAVFQPGLGHLYSWRPGLAISAWLINLACGAIYVWVILRSGGVVFYVATTVVITVNLGLIWHAWHIAHAPSPPHRPRRFRLALVLVACGILSIAISSALVNLVKRDFVQTYWLPSNAMDPTILQGDYFVVVRRRGDRLQRDAVVAYRWDGTDLVKRIAGLSGDTLEMRSTHLLRNGHAVSERFARNDVSTANDSDSTDFAWQRSALMTGSNTAQYHPTIDTWGPLVVPTGEVFVLGDNRHTSLDSRYIGFIAADSIIGQPKFVYLSRNSAGGIRWDRLGMRIE